MTHALAGSKNRQIVGQTAWREQAAARVRARDGNKSGVECIFTPEGNATAAFIIILGMRAEDEVQVGAFEDLSV